MSQVQKLDINIFAGNRMDCTQRRLGQVNCQYARTAAASAPPASLDGYKEELHPEFTSEPNVFYTTIKNVNYPPKDEKWVVKMGSSNANMGSSGT